MSANEALIIDCVRNESNPIELRGVAGSDDSVLLLLFDGS